MNENTEGFWDTLGVMVGYVIALIVVFVIPSYIFLKFCAWLGGLLP